MRSAEADSSLEPSLFAVDRSADIVKNVSQILIVKFADSNDASYQAVRVSEPNLEDPLSFFLLEKRRELEFRISKLAEDPSEFKGHGQKRSKREKNDIRKTKDKIRDDLDAQLRVLKGEELRPITIYTDQAFRLSRIEIGNFEPQEKAWWEYITKVQQGILDRSPQKQELLRDVFNARYNMKYRPKDEFHNHRANLTDLLERNTEIIDDVFKQQINQVREYFTKL